MASSLRSTVDSLFSSALACWAYSGVIVTGSLVTSTFATAENALNAKRQKERASKDFRKVIRLGKVFDAYFLKAFRL
jgi:hypothetical protein